MKNSRDLNTGLSASGTENTSSETVTVVTQKCSVVAFWVSTNPEFLAKPEGAV